MVSVHKLLNRPSSSCISPQHLNNDLKEVFELLLRKIRTTSPYGIKNQKSFLPSHVFKGIMVFSTWHHVKPVYLLVVIFSCIGVLVEKQRRRNNTFYVFGSTDTKIRKKYTIKYVLILMGGGGEIPTKWVEYCSRKIKHQDLSDLSF